MRNWILRWVASALALAVVSKVVPGIEVKDAGTLLITVIVLGLVNSLIRPIILFLVWPINCLTFGLLGFVINVGLFYIVGSSLVPGFHIKGIAAALIGSVAMGILSGLFSFILEDRKRD